MGYPAIRPPLKKRKKTTKRPKRKKRGAALYRTIDFKKKSGTLMQDFNQIV